MANILLGVLGALVVVLGIQTWRIDGLQQDLEDERVLSAQNAEAAKVNQQSFENCSAINQANEREAEHQRRVAEQAEIRANMLAAQVENQISQIQQQAERFDDEQCRTLSDPLPDDFVSWLRDP